MTAANPASNANPKELVTGVVRASYVHVFEAKLNEQSKQLEYSMAILISKDDTDTINAIKAASAAAAAEKWPDASKRPPNLRNPLRDGDVDRAHEEAYQGHYFVNLKERKSAPEVVDANLQPIIDARKFKSGDYVRVQINAYAYDKAGNRGVAFGLGPIMVVEEGEPLGGQPRSARDAFGSFAGGGEAAGAAEDMFE